VIATNPIISAGSSYKEGIYQLLTFGIPREAIPIMDDGSLNLSQHHKLLDILKFREAEEKRATQEKETKQSAFASSPASTGEKLTSSSPWFPPKNTEDVEDDEGLIVLIPSPMDILMGRGRQPNSRPGSLRMYHVLHENMDAYEAATHNAEKTKMAKKIIKEMKASGCRFLREVEEGGGYVEIDVSTARAKIAHRFRNLRRKSKIKNGAGPSTQVESNLSRTKKRSLSN
jgi:hypothetical protein